MYLAALSFCGQPITAASHEPEQKINIGAGKNADDPEIGFQVAREVLSTQTIRPYHYNGRVVDPSHPQWSNFRYAINKYPDALSCLKAEVREKPIIDMLDYDWDRIVGEVANEVCLFRIFDSLGHIDRVRAWMEFHGIELSPVRVNRNLPDRYTRVFDGHWSFADVVERSSIAGGFIARSINNLTKPNAAFLVGYIDDETITAISIVAITK